MTSAQRAGRRLHEDLVPRLNRVAGQRHLSAVRAGTQQAVPFLVVGSFALALAAVLHGSDAPFGPGGSVLRAAFDAAIGITGVWVAAATAYALAERYELDGLLTGLGAVMLDLLLASRSTASVLDLLHSGATGVLTAVLVGLATPELFRLVRTVLDRIPLPAALPSAVRGQVTTYLSLGLVLAVGWSLRTLLDVPALLSSVLTPVSAVVDTYWVMLLAGIVTQLLWAAGIQGNAVVTWGLLSPFLLSNVVENAIAFGDGRPAPHVFTEPMMWFVILGGVGCTLPLAVALLWSRSEQLRRLGRLSIVPALFFINEPVIYGLPIVFNRVLLIPFVGTQVVLSSITWFAMSTGLVQRTVLMPPWFALPPPLFQWFATAFDWRALVLTGVDFVIALVIWLPFLRAYESQQLRADARTQEERPDQRGPVRTSTEERT